MQARETIPQAHMLRCTSVSREKGEHGQGTQPCSLASEFIISISAINTGPFFSRVAPATQMLPFQSSAASTQGSQSGVTPITSPSILYHFHSPLYHTVIF